jgi:hypothetical protein
MADTPTYVPLPYSRKTDTNQLRVSVVAAGTNEALHVMRYDPQIASRFEQLELPVWRESDELRRFIAGYLALLPVRKAPAALDRRFVEYIVELTDGVTGRIVDVLRRAAMQAMIERTRRVGLEELQFCGCPITHDGRPTPVISGSERPLAREGHQLAKLTRNMLICLTAHRSGGKWRSQTHALSTTGPPLKKL